MKFIKPTLSKWQDSLKVFQNQFITQKLILSAGLLTLLFIPAMLTPLSGGI